MFYFLFSQKAQSTIEIIIAIVILVAAITAAILGLFGGQSISLDSQETNIALRMAQKEIEEIESRARYDFMNISSSSGAENGFMKEIIVTNLSTSTKEVVVRITWLTNPLRPQEIELVTLVTDWSLVAASGGDTGGGGLVGDWNNPKTLGSIDLGPGASATDLDVINKFVYISSVASSESKEDFYIINAEDGQNPYIVGKVNTGPGLNALDVIANYAFVAQNKTAQQLQVIDISNKTNPFLAAELTLPGVSGAGAIGWNVFYWDGKVYVGTKTATGPEFHVIDASVPASPVHLGSYEIGADVNEIRVVGSLAYLATSSDSKELLILNIADPAAITEAGFFDAPGNQDAKSVFLVSTKLYLGRVTGQNDALRILDISNPSSPQTLGTRNIGHDVTGIVVRDYLAFMGTSAANEEFQVWNISDPGNITKVSGFNFPQVINGIDYEDNLVYVAVRSNDALRIITSQ